jgi:Gluconate 2-dehydrogenase subunit 3
MLGAGLMAASGFLFSEVFYPSRLTASETGALRALVDTLIPEDETPGALGLGVAEIIISKTVTDSRYRTTVKAGSRWLDKMAKRHGGRHFSELDGEHRDLVIGAALAASSDALERIFMETMRSEAFEYYYSHPASWTQLAYCRHPQPDGFPDYDKQPSR